jgi:hypothetical protein
MRRLSILFVIAIVFALTALAPVSAGKRNCEVDTHPSCKDDTTPPTTQPPQLKACETNMHITGNGQTSFECLWTPVQVGDGAREAWVTVSGIEGGLKGPPGVFVRDDAPGDFCLFETEWADQTADQTGPVYTSEKFDLFYDKVPPGYEAWFEQSYWTLMYTSDYVPLPAFVGAYWCGPQDGVLQSIRFDTNGTPLHFMASFNARGGGQFDITLSPEQA